MAITCKEIRKEAWKTLRNQSVLMKLVGALLMIVVITVLVSVSLSAVLTGSWTLMPSEPKPLPVQLVEFVLSSVFTWGFVAMSLAAIRGEKRVFSLVFDGFSDPFRAIGCNLALSLSMLLWLLPGVLATVWLGRAAFVFGGVWGIFAIEALFIVYAVTILYRYVFVWFVKVEEPELGSWAAISKAVELMRGNRMRLFKLHLSYLVAVFWLLLPIVGALVFVAYVATGTALFYRHIRNAQTSNEAER